ncbi:hypothetical protein OC844_007377 [Tilletia horrida]|nr:hypothetical protein OC844_007377 [Tilletia horrida]
MDNVLEQLDQKKATLLGAVETYRRLLVRYHATWRVDWVTLFAVKGVHLPSKFNDSVPFRPIEDEDEEDDDQEDSDEDADDDDDEVNDKNYDYHHHEDDNDDNSDDDVGAK